MNDYGINDNTYKAILEMAAECNLSKVIIFGSRARGDYKRTSDIDLAISGGDQDGFSLWVDEDMPTLLTADVVRLNGPVRPELVSQIEKEGRVIYEKV